MAWSHRIPDLLGSPGHSGSSWDDGPDFGIFGMFQPIKEDDEVTVPFSGKNGWGGVTTCHNLTVWKNVEVWSWAKHRAKWVAPCFP